MCVCVFGGCGWFAIVLGQNGCLFLLVLGLWCSYSESRGRDVIDACSDHVCPLIFPQVDPTYYTSLLWMLENDITGVIDNTFTDEHDAFGVVETVELKEGGADIEVGTMDSPLGTRGMAWGNPATAAAALARPPLSR